MSSRHPLHLQAGAIQEYYIVDTGSLGTGNDKWKSTTVQEYTVPAGKMWWFYGGSVKNNVDATVTVDIYNSADKVILGLASIAAPGAGVRVQYPDSDIGYVSRPIPIEAGSYVNILMGAAQGATAEATCLVHECTVP